MRACLTQTKHIFVASVTKIMYNRQNTPRTQAPVSVGVQKSRWKFRPASATTPSNRILKAHAQIQTPTSNTAVAHRGQCIQNPNPRRRSQALAHATQIINRSLRFQMEGHVKHSPAGSQRTQRTLTTPFRTEKATETVPRWTIQPFGSAAMWSHQIRRRFTRITTRRKETKPYLASGS